MDSIATSGIKKADTVRADLGLNIFQPINVYDICLKFEIDVRFRRINMEGMYISSDNPENSYIILSSLRPFSRRIFTCAHELGHHLYGHGSQIDLIYQDNNESDAYNQEERLVDTFASALLMPIAGIQLEFQKRKWDLKTATPVQFFTISSVFGVGYQTLISNCRLNKLISYQKSKELLKYSPSHFLRKITVNEHKGHLKIIDSKYKESIVDTEVSGFLYLPKGIELEGNHLKVVSETKNGLCYEAIKPGVLRASNPNDGQTYFIRIQNFEYEGLSEYRHLEN
ncbi:ImmA/IrrE family metallo-endopeptidase [Salegentibacter mishustinae]|jgi:Zn-dependent peptidase ImmA (M78 family)|uniref:ImmA/IrrE family metallo-endopeptidase n=1 Tax=Salegentibacter mishustinae TaxID=270918 RepID=UPI001CE20455|nr:ImmA/IrrE family metallo-endopeptidase [Salegentibacter mishustinae]UBZ08615.1 ImmA/IrrE family metallo-endopeptidase [Salegentibacter mishustinae]